MDLIKVSASSRSTAVAGAIAGVVREHGRAEVQAWFAQPVRREAAPRDELSIKLAVAVTAPDVDVTDIIQTQRGETMRTLQQLTRLKMDADEGADLAWLLVLDRLIFDAEAEARWLDHCESRLARAAGHPKPPKRPAAGRSPRSTQGATR